jgi:phosphoserine aminotransferase
MSKVHNFSAGPSILAPEAFEKSIESIKNFAGTGLSILEISHRSKEFESVMDETEGLVRELLNVPSNYDVLFLQGGASTQFFQIPHNFLKTAAAYTKTGVWAAAAIKEAHLYGEVKVLASSEQENYCHIPKEFSIPLDVDYFHCTSNNTIYGTQMQAFPSSPVPLFCDMSSDIFSRPVNTTDFSLIYAGAQKNMGPAGVTLVIVNKDMYQRRSKDRAIPSMLDYKLHGEKGSMYNTPPVFSILVSKYNLEWVKSQGGTEGMLKRNTEKAALLYDAIDRSKYFKGTAAKEDRSKMNVCFVFNEADPELENKFNEACKEAKISGIIGHRSVGGYRASLYNALPLDSVQTLVNIMETFA